jgi:hypothetical protein
MSRTAASSSCSWPKRYLSSGVRGSLNGGCILSLVCCF